MEKLLSIIVPVYKVEKYLHKCVDSILSALKGQEEKYEVILVNDGSPDNCQAICDEYAKKQKHIHVLHQENGGLSDARNSGIKLAKGEYLAFVDSDDWVSEEMKDLIPQIETQRDVEAFQVGLTTVSEDDEERYKSSNTVCGIYDLKTSKDAFKILTRKLEPSACTRIIKKEFLGKNNLFFKKGRLCEDFDLFIRMLLVCEKYCFLDLNYYKYLCGREGSIINSKQIKLFDDMLLNSREAVALIKLTKQISKRNKKLLLRYISNHMMLHIYMVTQVPEVNLKVASKKLRKNKKCFSYPNGFNNKVFVRLTKIFGLRFALFMRRTYAMFTRPFKRKRLQKEC